VHTAQFYVALDAHKRLTITMAPLRPLNMYTTVKDFVTCFS